MYPSSAAKSVYRQFSPLDEAKCTKKREGGRECQRPKSSQEQRTREKFFREVKCLNLRKAHTNTKRSENKLHNKYV
jgi:hypothetical protein